MPLVRWSVTNREAKDIKVRAELLDILGNPTEYTKRNDALDELTAKAGTFEQTESDDPSLADWMGNRVRLTAAAIVPPMPPTNPPAPVPVEVLPMPLPQGSVDPDNVYELRVYVDPNPTAGGPSLFTVWSLDGIGGWWLLCDRRPVTLP